MDKKKLESIDDVLYTVTEGRIVRRRKNPLPALLIGVAGAGLAIWSLTASSMSEHENLASMLMLLGGGVALVGLIMAGIALASGSPVYEPTGEKIRRGSIYYDTARKQDLCAALEAGDADRLSRIPRGGSTSGVLLTLYATGSGSFAMAQVLEYVPHAFGEHGFRREAFGRRSRRAEKRLLSNSAFSSAVRFSVSTFSMPPGRSRSYERSGKRFC